MTQKLNELLDSTVTTVQDNVNNVLSTTSDLVNTTSDLVKNTTKNVLSTTNNVLSTTSDLVSNVTDTVTKKTSDVISMIINNKMVVTAVVGIALVVYCSKVSFKVPNFVLKLMNNSNVRLIVLFGIAYLTTQDISLALLSTVAFMLTLNKIAIYRNNKKIAKALKGSNLKKLDDSDSDSEQKSPEGSKNNIEGAPIDNSESETPKSETPKSEIPKSETPKSEKPKSVIPKPETPKSVTPSSEVSGYSGDNYATL